MKPSPHDDCPDDTESAVRHALRTAASAFTPSPWPAEAVRERAGRQRRARRLATVLPIAAAVMIAAVLAAGEMRDRATGRPSGLTPAASGRSTAGTEGSAVEVVPPGRSVDIGAGLRMRLAPTKVCFSSAGGAWQCEAAASDDGGVPWIDPRVRTAPNGTVYVPLFIGPRSPAHMTLTMQGHHYPLRLATLPGAPGYSVGYLATAKPPASGALPETTVTAYGQRWDILATVTGSAEN
ncbi:hypothetical protein ACFO3J_33315 [Streptomyces polygonati]|uniref:DUF4232 domain-containing protein n=1 Tax=Streptomyces polygonati TaxID=1617087 RepID=A0ABV8HWA6_9ACTN